MARLVLLSEGFTGRTYELKTEKITVGRVADNTFEIPEASVSSHHAELTLRGNDLHVKDLDSTNGTFINGERITEGVLKPGQILRLGSIDMRLETGEPVPSPKKVLDQTRVIPQGVKLDDLEGTRTPLSFDRKGFERKNNKATVAFVAVAIAIGVVLVGALVWVLISSQGQ